MNEQQVKETIANFRYPATPDLVAGVRHKLAAPQKPQRQLAPHRLAWAVAVLLALIAVSLTVPQVRAAVLRIFKIGAITVFVPEVVEETAVPPTKPPATLAQSVLLNPAGETTLSQLQPQTDMPLHIPAGWRLPDRVYRQTNDWPEVVIFVWLAPGSEEKAQLSLYQINAADFAYKQAQGLQEITIQGQPALWLEGGHWLQLQDGSVQSWLFVEGSVLVWRSEADGITFRLETGLSLAEAKAIAESLVLLPKKE